MISHSENPTRFAPGARLRTQEEAELVVEGSRMHGQKLIAKFEGVDDRNSAEMLRGTQLFVAAQDEIESVDGYWEHQIVGLSVYDQSGKHLGDITEVHVRPAQDLWEVTQGDQTVLLPAVEEFVKQVDLAAGRVIVDPPSGLFEEA